MSTSPTTPRQRYEAARAAYNAYMEAVDLHGDAFSEAILSIVLRAKDEANADIDRRIEARNALNRTIEAIDWDRLITIEEAEEDLRFQRREEARKR